MATAAVEPVAANSNPLGAVDEQWKVGKIVYVQARTWAGINRQGGQGTITKIHRNDQGEPVKLDVKYVLGGFDKLLDLHFAEPIKEEEERSGKTGRRRRSRSVEPKDTKLEIVDNKKQKVKAASTKPPNKENNRNAATKRKSNTKGGTGIKVKRTIGRQLVAKKQPKAKRKLVSDLKDKSMIKPVVDVPREILVCRTSAASSPSSSSSSAPSSPLSDIQNTPQPYMLPESMRRKSNEILFDNQDDDQSSFWEEEVRSPSPPPQTPESLFAAAPKPEDNAAKDGVSSPDLAVPKATLTAEHDRVMNDATHFINEVLKKEGDKTTAVTKTDEPSPRETTPSIDEEALADFFRALNEVLENNEDLAEEELVEEINQTCGKSFSTPQVQEFLDHLCQSNRIMRSDGQLFII